MEEIVGDLAAEAAALEELLGALDEDDWFRPTPAEGWDVRDSVAHLALGDDLAWEVLTSGPGPLMREAAAVLTGGGNAEQLEPQLLRKGRERSPAQVLAWWCSSNRRLREALLTKDPSQRLPWGPVEMSAASFATARLMETWAHGLDCFAAVGAEPRDTDRLRHVAFLSLRALPYALQSAGLPPPGPVRLELSSPSGQLWVFGPPDAPTVIRGTASDWCRVAVHRDRGDERARLEARGPDAAAVLANVRAYL